MNAKTVSIQEKHLNIKNRYYLRVKCWKKTFQTKGPKKQTSPAILLSSKIDFKSKQIRKDREVN